MGLRLQSILNSRLGVGLALGLGRVIPSRLGFRLAEAVADMLASRRGSEMRRAVRANQWVVTGEDLSPEQLDQAVQATFRHTAYCLYDLYKNLRDRPATHRRLILDPNIEATLQRIQEGKSGLVVVAPHLSNFDLVARSVAWRGLRGMAAMPWSGTTPGSATTTATARASWSTTGR